MDYPPAARERTEAGAEAFVRYFNEQVNTAWAAPRAGLVAANSLGTCRTCAAHEADAAKYVRLQQRYAADSATVGRVYPYGDTTPADEVYRVVTETHQVGTTVLAADGTVVEAVSAVDFQELYSLSFLEGRWKVVEIQVLR